MNSNVRERALPAEQKREDGGDLWSIEERSQLNSFNPPPELEKGSHLTLPDMTRLYVTDHNNRLFRIPSPDSLSQLSFGNATSDEGRGRSLLGRSCSPGLDRHASKSPPSPQTYGSHISASWTRNKGLALVLVAQLFGTLMNVTTRLLEVQGNNGKGMHPFQILFARMGITVLLSSSYMWYTQTRDFPFGAKEVRLLLVARGLTGFFGVFGVYYSLLYLPLADATVITFLAPSLACWACSFLIDEPFTRMEQIAACISLFGVVLIARPTALLSLGSSSPSAISDADAGTPLNATKGSGGSPGFANYDAVTPKQRLIAVGVAMLGVLGAAGAFTTIRWIGKRAHPLISVNYFATWCTIVSVVMMTVLPGVGFVLPKSLKEWGYLLFLGVCGFVMQFLLAAGLQHEKSSRATNMVYTQMLFALAFDKVVFGTTPGFLSIIGSSLILGSAIYVAIHKDAAVESQRYHPDEVAGRDHDEERGLVAGLESCDGDQQETFEMRPQAQQGPSGWTQEHAQQERVPVPKL